MCGRMNISDHEGVQWLLRSIGLMASPVQKPKFNVAPTRQLDVVTLEDGEPVLTSMSWGVSMKTKGKKGRTNRSSEITAVLLPFLLTERNTEITLLVVRERI